MDLILWRHAEAEDGFPDLGRKLTPKGHKQAARMARWLREEAFKDLEGKEAPGWRLLSSPARRAVQTVSALDLKFELRDALKPSATASAVLREAGWPNADHSVLISGHQPTLGEVAAQLLDAATKDIPIRKGAIWWFVSRERAGVRQTVLKAVLDPESIGGGRRKDATS